MQQIGRYKIVSELGRGAMGIVYRAEDPMIGRTVAIKTIRLGDITDPVEHQRLRDRLFREARSAGILSHPNIVTVYDIGEEGEMAYIAMEYVDGATLEHVMRGQPGPEKHVILSALYETGLALDFAHSKGIIHRDIKPPNIMINEHGAVKIADFGVAKILSHQVTQADLVLGTPSYMSPEQIEARALDGRSDQFAMAVIAYELLTGEKPFSADSLPSLLFKIVREQAEPAHLLNPSIGEEAGAVLAKAMEKASADRYETCFGFAEALIESLNAHPGWMPMARGMAASMATVAETAPQTARRRTTESAAIRPGTQAQAPTMARTAAAQARAATQQVEADKKKSPVMLVLALLGGLLIAGFVGWFVVGLLSTKDQGSGEPQPGQVVESPAVIHRERPSPASTPQTPAAAPQSQPAEPPPQTATSPAQPGSSSQPPAAASTGGKLVSVEIASTPAGAKVSIDQGATTCVTPCSVQIPSGRRVLEATLAGFKPTFKVFFAPEESKVSIAMEKPLGTLTVMTTPADAAVSVNGQTQSQRTPVTLKLPAGKYKIEIKKQGFADYVDDVEIRDQVTSTIRVTLAGG